MKLDIYITSVQPLMINDAICYDIFFVTKDSDEWKCLRIYNYYLSFIVARFPGMPMPKFVTMLGMVLEDAKAIRKRNIRDSSYFQLGKEYDYFEIIHTSPYTLKRIHENLTLAAKEYYSHITSEVLDKMNAYDRLFYKNTEQPFRFVSTTTSFTQSQYNLSCRYNVPLIGGATIDLDAIDQHYPTDYLPTNFVKIDDKHMLGLNANKLLTLRTITAKTPFNTGLANIVKNDSITFLNSLILMSYDIETFTRHDDDGKPIDINAQDVMTIARDNKCCEIMTIGIGLFKMNSHKPFKRICLITRDINDSTSQAYMKNKQLKPIQIRELHRNAYTVANEYTNNDKDDITSYIICKNECELLQSYITVLYTYHPHVVTAFNNFGFDDRYLYQRILNYSTKFDPKHENNKDSNLFNTLVDEYMNAYSPYPLLYINSKQCKFMSLSEQEAYENDDLNIDEIDIKYHFSTYYVPAFKEFMLKIDGEAYANNCTMISQHIINTDVYKLMLKEDAKRFTQDGYGTLNTMLDVYDITNPYNNNPLQKTDMSIQNMFDYWEKGTNIYEIGLYCTQDAWICGTLILKRNKFVDLIEMANMSNTSFKDSVYRADGIRVSNCVLGYGYANGFAVMDNTLEERARRICEAKGEEDTAKTVNKKKLDMRPMGAKTFDVRTIVGGQVRQIKAGREFGVVASDYSSMYPSNKEASNVDSSSRVDDDVIQHPEKYDLKIVRDVIINDMYGIGNANVTDNTTDEELEYLVEPRHIIYIKRIE